MLESDCNYAKDNRIFIQYTCRESEENMFEKRRLALIASALSIFTVLVVMSTVHVQSKLTIAEGKLFQLQTVEAKDYTVQIKFSESQLEKMGEEIVSHHPEFSHSMPKGQRCILYVMTEIEE